MLAMCKTRPEVGGVDIRDWRAAGAPHLYFPWRGH
jgi:hypothetical protein